MTKLLEQEEDDTKWERLFADPRSHQALERLVEAIQPDELEDMEVLLERCRAERKTRIIARRETLTAKR